MVSGVGVFLDGVFWEIVSDFESKGCDSVHTWIGHAHTHTHTYTHTHMRAVCGDCVHMQYTMHHHVTQV